MSSSPRHEVKKAHANGPEMDSSEESAKKSSSIDLQSEEAKPVAQQQENDEEEGGQLARMPRDILGVIFANLGPLQLLRTSHVCSRFRTVIRERNWSSKDMEGLTAWLRKEFRDFYMPYNRLSYYDRSYHDRKLTMTWPKRPLHLRNVFHSQRVKPFETFQQAGLRESQARDEILLCLSDLFKTQVEEGPILAVPNVQWEGHNVQMRLKVSFETYSDTNLFSLLDDSSSHEITLIWATNFEDVKAWQKMFSDRLEKAGSTSRYGRDFFGTQNYHLSGGTILVNSYHQLSIGQIMHLVRGDLPTLFPTLEEFESWLPQHCVRESRDNFAKILNQQAMGIDVPRALKDASWTDWFSPAEWIRWKNRKLMMD